VISLPVTLALRHPLWGGEVEIWVRQSWAQGGSQGQALGIGFRQAY